MIRFLPEGFTLTAFIAWGAFVTLAGFSGFGSMYFVNLPVSMR